MSYICRQYKVGYTVRSFPIESIHALTKHIEVHYQYVRERLHAGDIDLVYALHKIRWQTYSPKFFHEKSLKLFVKL